MQMNDLIENLLDNGLDDTLVMVMNRDEPIPLTIKKVVSDSYEDGGTVWIIVEEA